MEYVFFHYQDTNEATLYHRPVADSDAAYLREAAKHLKPLSDEQYLTGPAVILQTAAKFSYVLDGRLLYWCIEWEPGLVVVRMSPDGTMAWVAIRSPIPNFGGREPLPEDGDPDDYDDTLDNPQYNLIFTPWDAQFDDDGNEDFAPADDDVRQRFENALSHANTLGDLIESRSADDPDRWRTVCIENLEAWAGNGLRL